MSNAIFLLDEPPISDEPFPPGSYAHVKLVLDYRGRYPGELPDGVSTTHRLGVWHRPGTGGSGDTHGSSTPSARRPPYRSSLRRRRPLYPVRRK